MNKREDIQWVLFILIVVAATVLGGVFATALLQLGGRT